MQEKKALVLKYSCKYIRAILWKSSFTSTLMSKILCSPIFLKVQDSFGISWKLISRLLD